VTTGLRQSELFGLKWSDVDFEYGQINVIRSVVHGAVSNCKTESSMKPIPMGPELAKVLQEWKLQTRYAAPDDWVFASARTEGKRPMWGENMIRKPVRRALRKLGIYKPLDGTHFGIRTQLCFALSVRTSKYSKLNTINIGHLHASGDVGEARGPERRSAFASGGEQRLIAPDLSPSIYWGSRKGEHCGVGEEHLSAPAPMFRRLRK
jgi:hypothetical protein